jgi:hypothetical protein
MLSPYKAEQELIARVGVERIDGACVEGVFCFAVNNMSTVNSVQRGVMQCIVQPLT